MEIKKSKKAQLENKKSLFIQVGLVIALSLVLISFEWTSRPPLLEEISMINEIEYETDIFYTKRPDPPPEDIKPEPPQVIEVLEIVEDDIDTKDFNFDFEVDPETEYIFVFEEDEVIPEDDRPHVIVENMPTFNGGDPTIEFRKYIARNMTYPEIAAGNGIMGKVQVQFCVDKYGQVVDAIITRSVDPALDKEALRVVLASPKWEPGKQWGKPVKVIYSFPINFVLQ